MESRRPSDMARERYRLAAVFVSLRAADLLERPELCGLAADDIAWTVAMQDCYRREPRRWQPRRRRAWSAEVAELMEERHRIGDHAAELGLLT